jgi:hypothetical protein
VAGNGTPDWTLGTRATRGFRGRYQTWPQPATAQWYPLGGRGVAVRPQWHISVVHDEQSKLDSEEQDISPQQLEKWIVLLDNECKGKGICKPPKLDADGFVIGMSREKKRSGHNVFATLEFGQRY